MLKSSERCLSLRHALNTISIYCPHLLPHTRSSWLMFFIEIQNWWKISYDVIPFLVSSKQGATELCTWATNFDYEGCPWLRLTLCNRVPYIMRHYINSTIRSGVLRYLNGRFENIHMLPDVYIITTNAANGNEPRVKQSFKVTFFTVYVLFRHSRHFHRVFSVFLKMNLIIHCRVTQLENDCGSGIIQKDIGKLHRYQTKKNINRMPRAQFLGYTI